MSSSFDRYQKRRLISSYFSVVISIALVLFLLGIVGFLLLNAKKVTDFMKENVNVTVYLKDTAKDVEIKQLEKSLALADYVKTTDFVSKDDAAEAMKSEFGDDFMDLVGYNPLQNSIDVKLKADFLTNEKLEELTALAQEKSFVDEVKYDESLVELINSNVKKISFWVLLLSAIFTLIAVLLINSSIRLSVYSKRFTIKTMQMVGATKSFIRRPFVWKSIKLGILGAVVALIGLGFVVYYVDKMFPELALRQSLVLIGGLFLAVFLLGIIITWISTHFATQRFLNLKTDQLY
ncbi:MULTISPECIES: ABC transporter permease [Mesoflavibacter]|uniref:Cell division protein FtsX n=1 Tax=Mesoflavibacter zeaxanthinifaciens subsp. sabulilitoris TaxID=1520893 RepID=A0A2T1N777_9FLAO|nr:MULTISPECIES: permease-like cell division protein FtsX [Mesoflavibacter]MCP4052513.1 ABC transporter permease [Mesoflavibacter sp.]HIC32823.1 ABC transporter permease [Flavobacteriaceae bacterium]MBB3124112.1 cell division transport system permease protein [Mesoflavibacter zeaxanthinifaciens subsp. sabulilitoris]PSG87724.1 ABC transporter permease [Mesoflavibacter zeaxanthinifaciens subsp. sabulilitoris]UAB76188.1 ABC transporter permease [Mesoflavibacter sp. SCSIO 43206]